jgi:type II secretory pathway pseudopilin PulG
VVIAIIAILASMLLPALSQSKDKVLIVLCVSRCKQVGVALTMYAEDHSGYYPDRPINYPSELGWLRLPDASHEPKRLNAGFLDYGGATDIFYCPATSRTDPQWPGTDNAIDIKVNPDSATFFTRDYPANEVVYTTIQIIAGFNPPTGNFGTVNEGLADGPYDPYEPLQKQSQAAPDDVLANDWCESDNGYTEPVPTAGTTTLPGYGIHHNAPAPLGCTGSSRVNADGSAYFRKVTDEDYRARLVRAPALKHLFWFW